MRKSQRLTGMHLGRICVLVLPIAALLGGCERQPAASSDNGEPSGKVYATFYPVAYLAERIAGEHVQVVNPCPADADPAYWMPKDDELAAFQTKADLIIANGADFEKWLGKATLPESRLVDTTASFHDELIHLHDAVTHSHGPGGEHTHIGVDGHTWLDPENAIRQANAIEQALSRRYPKHADAFKANLASLTEDLRSLDKRLRAVSEKMGGRTIFANHPAWNYLARSYGWDLCTFHLDPEEMPDAEQIAHIRGHLDHDGATHILWEAEPTSEIAERFEKELGLRGIVYSPGETLSDEQRAAGEDFLSIMNANIDRLEAEAKNMKPRVGRSEFERLLDIDVPAVQGVGETPGD